MSFKSCNYKVGIVGSDGRMGSWMFSHLKESGLEVHGIDKAAPTELGDFTESSDVMVLAIPSSAFPEVTRVIGPRLRKESLLIDIASLKQGPVREMLDHFDGEVIGAHPMFGPSAESFRDRLVYLCPARPGLWTDKVSGFLTSLGARIHIISPDRHDRLMATVQTLRHIMLTSLGLTLRSTGFDISEDLKVAGEWFQQLITMMERQFDQPSELYADLALNNPHSLEVLKTFSLMNEKLNILMEKGDKKGIMELMNMVRDFTGR